MAPAPGRRARLGGQDGARGLRTPRGLAWQVAQAGGTRDRLGKGVHPSTILRFTKAKVSPRAMRYEFEPGQDARLVLEPWEQRIPLRGPSTATPSHA